jgi:hypothetical protein
MCPSEGFRHSAATGLVIGNDGAGSDIGRREAPLPIGLAGTDLGPGGQVRWEISNR